MPFSDSDILFLLSGGTNNNNADEALGGGPSIHSIAGRTLFDDISEDDMDELVTDYRCFYISNDHESETLHAVSIYIESQVEEGADVQLGFLRQDEVQQVVINSSVSSGSFVLDYNGTEFTVAYNATLATWATNFTTAINAVETLEEVTVSASQLSGVTTFQVTFAGTAGYRYHPILTNVSDTLSPATTITISKVVSGSPINTEADEIDRDTTVPNSIVFQDSDVDNQISIGPLYPTDLFPVWVKRSIDSGASPIENDGFVVKIKGSPVL